MLSHLAHAITALSLALVSHASIPGWTSTAWAAPAKHKCTAKPHRHAKPGAMKPAPRGGGVVQLRRPPDVLILTSGAGRRARKWHDGLLKR